MTLARLITHYGSTVASIEPFHSADHDTWAAMLTCSHDEESVHVALTAEELRESAAGFMDLADEIDGRNKPEEVVP